MNVKPHYLQKQLQTMFVKYRDTLSENHQLSYLFWECTLRCNLNCIHCGSDCKSNSRYRDMPSEDFLKVVDQISKTNTPKKTMIVITGGEPLMRNDLEEIGSQLHKRGFPWGFVTNGYALTEARFKRLLKAGLCSVTLSLDGMEKNHNWLRNHKNGFKKAIETIKIITRARGLMFDVATCMNRQNFSDLPDLKQLLMQLGVKHWRLFSITPIGRAKNNEAFDLSDRRFYELMEFISKTRKEGKIKASYGCEGYLGAFEKKVRDGYYFCRAGINIASILADGSVSACPNIDRSFAQGNIYKDDFMEIWNNKFETFRNRSWKKQGICADCDSFKICQGNGMHLWDVENNKVLRCHFQSLQVGLPCDI